MKVVGLSCSPRKKGNTDLLLNELLRGAREGGATTERLDVWHLRISPCRGCGACETTGRCAIGDEMEVVYDRINNANAIALASPIYFYNVTAQCKMMIDRCQAFWSQKYVLQKIAPQKLGFFLSVGATKGRKMFDGAILTVRYFFDAINASCTGHLLFREIDKKGEIRNHPTALREAHETGKELVRNVQQMNTKEESLSRRVKD